MAPRTFFVAVDQAVTTAHQWRESSDFWTASAERVAPPAAVGATAPNLIIFGVLRQRGTQSADSTKFFYPGAYTVGNAQPVRMWDGVTDVELFTIPINSQAFNDNGAVQYGLRGGGGIRQMLCVGTKIYIATIDFVWLGGSGSYSRVMEYDLDTSVLTQVGQFFSGYSAPNPVAIGSTSSGGSTGGSSGVVWCLGWHNDQLYVGYGADGSASNSIEHGIYRITPPGTTYTYDYDNSAVGFERPTCMAEFLGELYAGFNDSNTALSHIRRRNSGAWTSVHSAGAQVNSGWTDMIVFGGALYASLYNQGAGNATTSIWRTTDGTTWTSVKTVEGPIANPLTPVGMIVVQGALYVYSINTSRAGMVSYTEDGTSWTDLSMAVNTLTSVWGVVGPPEEEVLLTRGEGEIGLTWVERQDSQGDVHVSSKIALADPLTYYHGFKRASIISWGRIRRALSDRNGQYEGTDFSWVESDVDRFIRTQLSNESTRYFVNQGFTVRMIADPDRRLLLTPRTVVKGILRNYRPLSPLHFEFTGQDILAAKFDPLNTADQLPQRTITAADFPTCPPDILGLAVPIVYGEVSDKNEVTETVPGTPGTPTTVGLRKPTNLTATVIGGAGSKSYSYGVTALDNRDRQHNTFSSRTNHAGETDAAYVSVTNAPDLDEMSSSRYVELDWDNVPGAHHYRIYGRAHRQTLTLNLLDSAKATGAGKEERYNDGERNGRTEIDREKTDSHPPKQNNTVKSGDPGSPETSITTDRGRGVVPTIYVGERTIGAEVWSEFLVCGHAIKSVLGVYRKGVRVTDADLTANYLIPGSAEWTAELGATTYRDYNGHRYTVIYVRGEDAENARDILNVATSHGMVTTGIPPLPAPSAASSGAGEPITLNVQGIEDVGDGSGTLISSLPLQYRHFVVNWLLQSYLAGAWLATPVFPDDLTLTQIDEGSFDDVNTVANERIAGGYVGGFIIGTNGQLVGVRDMIAKLNVNCDCDSGFNRKTQFMVSMASEAISQLNDAGSLSDVTDIFSGSFDIEDRVDELFNHYDYRYARNYSTTDPVIEWSVGQVSDSVSITNYQETKKAPQLDLEMIRSAAIASDIVTRKLLRTKTPPRIVKLETGLHGFNYELGDIIRLTHYEGVGPNGWEAQPVRILRHEADPNSYSVSLECFDMGAMFGTSGGGGGPFILGDETSLPASWPSTTPAQKAYGYLCDETTGQFSDGLEGKHLR